MRSTRLAEALCGIRPPAWDASTATGGAIRPRGQRNRAPGGRPSRAATRAATWGPRRHWPRSPPGSNALTMSSRSRSCSMRRPPIRGQATTEPPAAGSATRAAARGHCTRIKSTEGFFMHFDWPRPPTRPAHIEEAARSVDRGGRGAAAPALEPDRGGTTVRPARATSICCATTSPISAAGRRCGAAAGRGTRSRALGPRPHRRDQTGCGRRPVPPTSPPCCPRLAAIGNSALRIGAATSGGVDPGTDAHLTAEIGKLFPRCAPRRSPPALRKDLAEIADTLKKCACRRARSRRSSRRSVALGARIEANRESLSRSSVIADIERSLGDRATGSAP